MEEEDRRGSRREEERMDGVKGEICYSGLGERDISQDRKREEEEMNTYRLGIAYIFGTMNVNDFWM